MDINSKEYYVYGLCDPLTDEVFYIGKGKGNRAEQHLKEKIILGQGNSGKLNKIKNILDAKKEVKIIYYIQNINEEAAFFLEEILIERIGRSCLKYGPLSNLMDGGTKEYSKLSLRGYDAIRNDKLSVDFAIAKYPELKKIIDSVPRTTKEDEVEENFKLTSEQVRTYVTSIIQTFDPNIFDDLEAKNISYRNHFSGRAISFESKYGVCEICLGDKEPEKKKLLPSASTNIRNSNIFVFSKTFLSVENITKRLREYMQIADSGVTEYIDVSEILSSNRTYPIYQVYPNTIKDELKITAQTEINNIEIKCKGKEIFNKNFNSELVQINIKSLPIGEYSIKVNNKYFGKMIKFKSSI